MTVPPEVEPARTEAARTPRPVLAQACLVLLVAASLVLAWAQPLPAEDEFLYRGSLGDAMTGRLYLPTRGSAPFPAVVCVQSVFAWPGVSVPMCREMARHGFIALAVPLSAYSPQAGRYRTFSDYERDIAEAVRALRRRPDVDPRAVSLVGQSMGADLVCSVARRDRSIRSCVAIGFPVDAEAKEPANLLMAVGAWDELHPLGEMRAALHRATDGEGDEPGRLYGSAKMDRARFLLILPRADHMLENFDADLFRTMRAWMSGGFHGAVPDGDVRMPYRMMAQGAAILALAGLLLWLLATVAPQVTGAASRIPVLGPALAPRALFLLAFVALVVLGLLHRSWPHPALHPTMLAILLGMVAVNALARASTGEPEADRPSLVARLHAAVGRALLYALPLVLAVATALVLNGGAAIAWDPSLLLQAPLFVAQALPIGLATALGRLSDLLFYDIQGTTGIHPITAFLLVAEAAAPGALLLALSRIARAIVRTLQALDFRPRFQVSPGTAVLLVLLLAGAGVAWMQVFRGGYALDGGDLARFAGVLARLFVVPPLIVIAMVRRTAFRRVEASLEPPR